MGKKRGISVDDIEEKKPQMGPASKKKKPNYAESDDDEDDDYGFEPKSNTKKTGGAKMGPASKKKKPNYAESDDEDDKDFNDISPPSSPEVKKKKKVLKESLKWVLNLSKR